MSDLTVYVPDDVAARARAAGIPLSRAMRLILQAVLAELEDTPRFDPVVNVLALMEDR